MRNIGSFITFKFFFCRLFYWCLVLRTLALRILTRFGVGTCGFQVNFAKVFLVIMRRTGTIQQSEPVLRPPIRNGSLTGRRVARDDETSRLKKESVRALIHVLSEHETLMSPETSTIREVVEQRTIELRSFD